MAPPPAQRSGTGGTLALVLGILNLVAALASAVLSFGAGTCGLVCCMGLGMIASVVPALALCGSALGIVVSLAVMRSDPNKLTGTAPTMAKVGFLLSTISGLLNMASLLFVIWPLILSVFIWILGLLEAGWNYLMLQLS